MTRLSDGRVSIGTANHSWEYGKQILTFTIAAGMALGQTTAANHDAAAVALVQPIVDKIKGNVVLRASLVSTLLSLAGGSSNATAMSLENEH